jgi:NADP oxidoreductase coenzyme F420-dependent
MSRKFIVWFGSFVAIWQDLCWAAAAWIPPSSIRLSSPDRYHIKTATKTTTTETSTTTRRYEHQPLHHSDDNNKNETNGIRFGILGCGTIGSAIARGIMTQTRIPIQSIIVTKRSESKSKELQQEFPSIISCYESPQTILDRSDWIFLTVLPQQTTNMLQSLTWDPSRHYLISLVVRLDKLIGNEQTIIFTTTS